MHVTVFGDEFLESEVENVVDRRHRSSSRIKAFNETNSWERPNWRIHTCINVNATYRTRWKKRTCISVHMLNRRLHWYSGVELIALTFLWLHQFIPQHRLKVVWQQERIESMANSRRVHRGGYAVDAANIPSVLRLLMADHSISMT